MKVLLVCTIIWTIFLGILITVGLYAMANPHNYIHNYIGLSHITCSVFLCIIFFGLSAWLIFFIVKTIRERRWGVKEIKNPELIWSYATCIKGKKHCFEPRYDYGQPLGGTTDFRGNINDYIRMQNADCSKTYVYDICIKCGMIIDKKANGGDE